MISESYSKNSKLKMVTAWVLKNRNDRVPYTSMHNNYSVYVSVSWKYYPNFPFHFSRIVIWIWYMIWRDIRKTAMTSCISIKMIYSVKSHNKNIAMLKMSISICKVKDHTRWTCKSLSRICTRLSKIHPKKGVKKFPTQAVYYLHNRPQSYLVTSAISLKPVSHLRDATRNSNFNKDMQYKKCTP